MTRTLFAGALTVAVLGGAGRADTVISTLDLLNPVQVFQPFGDPSAFATPYYGQSLTVPAGGGSFPMRSRSSRWWGRACSGVGCLRGMKTTA